MSAGERGGNAGVAQPPTFFPMKRPAACIPKPKEETKKPKADTKDTNQLTADNVEQFKDQPLDQKLELYRSWASKQIDAGQLDYQLLNKVLRQLMDQNNMSALWSRLKTSLKKTGSKQVREAWEKICDKGMREGKTDKKSEVLCINLALGSDTDKNWEDYLSEEFLSLAQVDKVASTGEWMYYGALEKKHGKEELDDMIKKGNMETTTDRWGGAPCTIANASSPPVSRSGSTGQRFPRRSRPTQQPTTRTPPLWTPLPRHVASLAQPPGLMPLGASLTRRRRTPRPQPRRMTRTRLKEMVMEMPRGRAAWQ